MRPWGTIQAGQVIPDFGFYRLESYGEKLGWIITFYLPFVSITMKKFCYSSFKEYEGKHQLQIRIGRLRGKFKSQIFWRRK